MENFITKCQVMSMMVFGLMIKKMVKVNTYGLTAKSILVNT